MSRLVAVLAGALVALFAFDFTLWRAAGEAREHKEALLARVAVLEAAGGAPVRPASEPRNLSQAPQVAAPAPAPAAGDAAGLAAGIRQTMETPEGREYTRSMLLTSLELQYPDLARELGISQELADRLLGVLARHGADVQVDRSNLREAAATDPDARAQMARELAAKEQAHEAEVSALLGDRYGKWKDYQRTAPARQQETYARQQREQLRQAVDSRGNPLGQAQFDAFATAVDAEQKRIDGESARQTLEQRVQSMPEHNRRLLAVAADHLDPAQLERYRRHLELQSNMMRVTVGAMDVSRPPAPR